LAAFTVRDDARITQGAIMTTTITEKTDKTGTHVLPMAPPKSAETVVVGSKSVDVSTAVLISVAGIVSGWLSYNGAAEIFGDQLTAFGFTIVVQGVVSLALWYFAEASTLPRILLGFAWAAAVTFSIGTAYVTADRQSGDKSSLVDAQNELVTYFSEVAAAIKEVERDATLKSEAAKSEAKNGGCGKKCQSLQAEADQLAAHAKLLQEGAGEAIKRAQNEMYNSTSLAELLVTYQKLKPELASVDAKVNAPSFIDNTDLSAFERISRGWEKLTSGDQIDVATLGAFWAACLMELLAVACAVIRIASRITPSRISIKTKIERAIAWFTDLGALPARVSILTSRQSDSWMKENNPKPAVSSSQSQSRSEKPIKTDREFWSEGLQVQAEIEKVTVLELIHRLVQEPAAPLLSTKRGDDDACKSGAIKTILMNTEVLTENRKGELAITDKWKEWVAFLFDEHQRQRQVMKKGAGPVGTLRSVG
jgi:hypothetical protein